MSNLLEPFRYIFHLVSCGIGTVYHEDNFANFRFSTTKDICSSIEKIKISSVTSMLCIQYSVLVVVVVAIVVVIQLNTFIAGRVMKGISGLCDIATIHLSLFSQTALIILNVENVFFVYTSVTYSLFLLVG